MAFIVTDSCIKCKYTDCVEVCPVDCFHEGPNFLAIDPDECIDCALCEPECPVNAIMTEDAVPQEQKHFIALNAELSKQWPVINTCKGGLPDADQWKDVNPEDGLRLADELQHADLHQLIERVHLQGPTHGSTSSSSRCRPVRCTNTSSRVACRVVSDVRTRPSPWSLESSAGITICGSATDKQ